MGSDMGACELSGRYIVKDRHDAHEAERVSPRELIQGVWGLHHGSWKFLTWFMDFGSMVHANFLWFMDFVMAGQGNPRDPYDFYST